ncbi:MAG: Sir2 family NAD-dependent protein deacetylase [Deltaproteobacteria bacterium]|nr:Sir2 family NAD-dependent protein deacetylase [Deltaproteobacteria bacterium]
MSVSPTIDDAAAALTACFDDDGVLLFCAGAGMGVDSGLPDFRGPQGFWNAYPAYAKLGLSFMQLANPAWFEKDPALAWGFYGHRLSLYRKTDPHEGYRVLRAFGERVGGRWFAFTSNVDGAFGKAGFDGDRVCEAHGAIQTFQCTVDDHGLWDAPAADVDVDPVTFRASPPFPLCPRCGALARPNILMFDDGGWHDQRTHAQHRRLTALLESLDRECRVVVVEAGAGSAVPTVRGFSEQMLRRFPRARLVRINVREPEADRQEIKDRVIGIADGAKAALVALQGLC